MNSYSQIVQTLSPLSYFHNHIDIPEDRQEIDKKKTIFVLLKGPSICRQLMAFVRYCHLATAT